MLSLLTERVHASRRRLLLSFPVALAASFLVITYGPTRLLGEIMSVFLGVAGIYMGVGCLYLHRSALQDRKAIRFGHGHPVKIGIPGLLFLSVGMLIALSGSVSLLWRIAFQEPKPNLEPSSQVITTNDKTSKAPDTDPPKLRPTSHADCNGQPTCKECLRAPLQGDDSTCVPAKLRNDQEFPLTKDTHGLSGKLLLLLDDCWHRPGEENYRGHRIDDRDPLAAAVLRVVGEDGETVDEVEDLHPAVSVEVKKLGDGTETFLVTQEFLCAAGRYCGWDTRFLQVRNGKLKLLEAEGAEGEVEQAWFTQSQAAGWKLDEVGGGNLDIVHQRFDLNETKGEMDVQTRFYFWEGKWRFARDTVYHTEDREPSALRPPQHR